MLSSSNAKVQIIILLVAILVGIIWSPIPKQIGFYPWLFETLDPALIGCLPCSMTALNDWGYTFDELYDSTQQTIYTVQHPKNALYMHCTSTVQAPYLYGAL